MAETNTIYDIEVIGDRLRAYAGYGRVINSLEEMEQEMSIETGIATVRADEEREPNRIALTTIGGRVQEDRGRLMEAYKTYADIPTVTEVSTGADDYKVGLDGCTKITRDSPFYAHDKFYFTVHFGEDERLIIPYHAVRSYREKRLKDDKTTR